MAGTSVRPWNEYVREEQNLQRCSFSELKDISASLSLILGATDLRDADTVGRSFKVSAYKVHPQYVPAPDTHFSDLAIIKLDDPNGVVQTLLESCFVVRSRLPENKDHPDFPPQSTIIAAGWGKSRCVLGGPISFAPCVSFLCSRTRELLGAHADG